MRNLGVVARPVDDAVHQRQQRIRRERVLERRDLVRHAPEGPDVGLQRVRLVLAHLRTQVIRRPSHGGGEIVRPLQHARDTEIPELHDAAAAEEDVLRLQIAVHNAHGVDVVQRERDLRGPVQDLALREVSARVRFASALDVREQVALLGVRGHDAQAVAAMRRDALLTSRASPFERRLLLLLLLLLRGGQETLLVRDDVRVLDLRQKLRLRERLPARGDVVHGYAFRDVAPVLLQMRHDVARAVVAVPDDVAERVLLHRDSKHRRVACRARRRAPEHRPSRTRPSRACLFAPTRDGGRSRAR